MAEAAEKAPPKKKKRGRMTTIVVGLLIVLTPISTWFALDFVKKPADPKTKLAGTTNAAAAAAANTVRAPSAGDYERLGAPSRLPVPLVRTQLVYVVNEDKGVPPFVVPTNAQPVKDMEKMVVRLADRPKAHYAVTQLYLVANNTDRLIAAMNRKTNAAMLYDKTLNVLSNMTLNDVKSASFRNVLRGSVIRLCNLTLGSNVVQEVAVTDFLAQ